MAAGVMKIQRAFSIFPMALCAVAVISVSLLKGDVVSLESTKGSRLEAEQISCDGTSFTIARVSDGKTFSLPLDRLTQSSQDAVKAWQSKGGGLNEKFGIEVATGKTRRKNGTEDYDDKRVNLDPIITISNPEVKVSSREAKVTALFLGRPVADNGALYVFKKETFDLPSLAPTGVHDIRFGKISASYDSRGYAKFGARYIGYVVIVHDKEGKRVYSSSSVPTSLVNGAEFKFLKLEAKKNYDKDFKPLKLPTYTDF
jgi:hypothetical protein